MKIDGLIRDPIFQTNLLVWMATPQPAEGCCVSPLFAKHGFGLLYVEQPFPFPAETRNAIDAAADRIEISIHPEPDLILKRDADQQALYFEAKANSFSADSPKPAKQARAHLLASGPPFAEVYRPLRQSTLTYVVPEAARAQMATCLTSLSAQMESSGFNPASWSVGGLSAGANAISYHVDPVGAAVLGCAASTFPLITGIADDTDPSPLLLVYSDQDCPSEERAGHYRRALQNQVLACLLCELHQRQETAPVELSAADLLMLATNGVFGFTGRERQRGMERLISENIFRRIVEYWKERVPDLIRVDRRILRFDFQNDARKEQFMDWLESRRTGFDDTKVVGESNQPELFPAG